LIELNPEEDAMKEMIRFFAIFALFTVACGHKTTLCQPQTAYYTEREIQDQITKMRNVAQELVLESRQDGNMRKRSLALDASIKLEIASATTDPSDRRTEFNEAFMLLTQAQEAPR
jgi:Na+-translocating ferredoxin:NAD+ oxidoreductase RnfG subunit